MKTKTIDIHLSKGDFEEWGKESIHIDLFRGKFSNTQGLWLTGKLVLDLPEEKREFTESEIRATLLDNIDISGKELNDTLDKLFK